LPIALFFVKTFFFPQRLGGTFLADRKKAKGQKTNKQTKQRKYPLQHGN